MTKARDIADGQSVDTTNFVTKSNGIIEALDGSALTNLTADNLDDTGTIPSQLLAGVGGGENTPAFHTYLSYNLDNSHNSWFKAPFNSETFDTDSAYDNTTNHKFTVPEAGKYNLYVSCGMMNNVGVYCVRMWVAIRVNGSDKAMFGFDSNQASHTRQESVGGSTVQSLSVGDEVEVYVFVETGDSSNARLIGGEETTYFGGFKLAE